MSKSSDVKELSVQLPFGELVAQVGEDEKIFPEIFLFLRRPDGIEIDLTMVGCDTVKKPDKLTAYLWADPNNEQYTSKHEWSFDDLRSAGEDEENEAE